MLDRAERLERERRTMIQAVEERKAARNAASAEVAQRKRKGEDASELIERARGLGEEIARLEGELSDVEQQLQRILFEIPNMTLPDVPAGGEDANRVVKAWGTPRKDPGLKPHWDIGERLGIIDLDRAAKISGSG
ncbi:MAG: serine--tRNA ligase, partial [Betaproteobacteria bacterium]